MSRFHEIDIKGKHWVHRVADKDTHTHEGATDKARVIYSEDDEKLYIGSGSGWETFTTQYDVLSQNSKVLMGSFPLPTNWNIDTRGGSNEDIIVIFTETSAEIGTPGGDTWTIEGLQEAGNHNHAGRTKGPEGGTIVIGQSEIYDYVGDDRHNHNISYDGGHFHSFSSSWRPAYVKYCVAEYQ